MSPFCYQRGGIKSIKKILTYPFLILSLSTLLSIFPLFLSPTNEETGSNPMSPLHVSGFCWALWLSCSLHLLHSFSNLCPLFLLYLACAPCCIKSQLLYSLLVQEYFVRIDNISVQIMDYGFIIRSTVNNLHTAYKNIEKA